MTNKLRVVIDTNVMFEGLTKKGTAPALIIEAWLTGLIEVCASNSLMYEYEDVLYRKLSSPRWQSIQPILKGLLQKLTFTVIYYSWRPTSPDPGDDLVIDCAMNADAAIVTSNLRDFQGAKISLGVQVLTPVQLIIQLSSGVES